MPYLIVAGAGSLRSLGGSVQDFSHRWTAEGVTVEAEFTVHTSYIWPRAVCSTICTAKRPRWAWPSAVCAYRPKEISIRPHRIPRVSRTRWTLTQTHHKKKSRSYCDGSMMSPRSHEPCGRARQSSEGRESLAALEMARSWLLQVTNSPMKGALKWRQMTKS